MAFLMLISTFVIKCSDSCITPIFRKLYKLKEFNKIIVKLYCSIVISITIKSCCNPINIVFNANICRRWN